ncbi:hypothetical protein ACJDU8_00540 [Clostridium sp. WILCCON 0269]|uniref:ABC-2 family transporter protein n=1 Tax=Candidatus Clostridium eludens TaxID=3381663 RepID=A0ABW8SDX6_9CLOT
MKYNNYSNKNIFKVIFISILISIIIYLNSKDVIMESKCNYLDALFIFTYGYMDIKNIIKYISNVFIQMLPLIYITYILGDYIFLDLDKRGVYIFTRTNKRTNWFLNKILKLLKYVSLFYFIQLITIYIIGIIIGFRSTNYTIQIIFWEFTLNVLTSYFIILFINVISLKLNVIYTYIIGIGIYVSSIFISGFVYQLYNSKIWLLKYFIIGQEILTWHCESFLNGYRNIADFYINNLNIKYSISYLSIVCIIMVFYGFYVINNKDIT